MSDLLIGTGLALAAMAFVLYPLFADEAGGASGDRRSRGTARRDALGAEPSDDDLEALIRAHRDAPAPCAACGPRPEPDAIYCSSCGRRLGSQRRPLD